MEYYLTKDFFVNEAGLQDHVDWNLIDSCIVKYQKHVEQKWEQFIPAIKDNLISKNANEIIQAHDIHIAEYGLVSKENPNHTEDKSLADFVISGEIWNSAEKEQQSKSLVFKNISHFSIYDYDHTHIQIQDLPIESFSLRHFNYDVDENGKNWVGISCFKVSDNLPEKLDYFVIEFSFDDFQLLDYEPNAMISLHTKDYSEKIDFSSSSILKPVDKNVQQKNQFHKRSLQHTQLRKKRMKF